MRILTLSVALIALLGCQEVSQQASEQAIELDDQYVWLSCTATEREDDELEQPMWLRFERNGGEEALIIDSNKAHLWLRAVVSPEMISVFEPDLIDVRPLFSIDRKTMLLSTSGFTGQCVQSDGRAVQGAKI